MRMRIVGDRGAVRRPARMRDAGFAVEVAVAKLQVQVLDALHRARALEPVTVQHGDAAGIVAAIFQAPQAFDEDGYDVATGDCADYSTHIRVNLSFVVLLCVVPSFLVCSSRECSFALPATPSAFPPAPRASA